MRSCFNCAHKSHEKQTMSGPEAVCGVPGCPLNWNKNKYQYEDIADQCKHFVPKVIKQEVESA